MMTTAAAPFEDCLTSDDRADAASKTGFRLLWAAAALLVMVTTMRLVNVLKLDSQLDAASGVFTALAYDVAHGEMYRPLYGGIGYGGTRYFPLHPALQAGLMKCGLPPLAAGYMIAFVSGILLVSGVYQLLRRLGIRASYAMPCAAIALATVSGQWAITTIRGDLLPAALNVWGLAFCAATPRQDATRYRFHPVVPALFFTLAFSGKMTTLFGAAAVFWSLGLARRWKDAFRFAGCMIVGLIVFIGVMQWVSHGWFLKTFRICADSDADLDTYTTAPVAMVHLAFRTDPGAILFWVLGLGTLLCVPRKAWKELPALAFMLTAAATLVIFGSPGTAINHLLDLHVIAVVFFVSQCARGRIPGPAGMTILAVAALVSAAGTTQVMRAPDNINRTAHFATTLRQLRGVQGPVLFEIPTLAVLAGQRPYMTDPYMFAVIGIKHPEVAAEFLAKIDRREFGAIVCFRDPAETRSREWFDTAFFGKGFIEHVLANYERLPKTLDSDFVYVPIGSGLVTRHAPAPTLVETSTERIPGAGAH